MLYCFYQTLSQNIFCQCRSWFVVQLPPPILWQNHSFLNLIGCILDISVSEVIYCDTTVLIRVVSESILWASSMVLVCEWCYVLHRYLWIYLWSYINCCTIADATFSTNRNCVEEYLLKGIKVVLWRGDMHIILFVVLCWISKYGYPLIYHTLLYYSLSFKSIFMKTVAFISTYWYFFFSCLWHIPVCMAVVSFHESINSCT